MELLFEKASWRRVLFVAALLKPITVDCIHSLMGTAVCSVKNHSRNVFHWGFTMTLLKCLKLTLNNIYKRIGYLSDCRLQCYVVMLLINDDDDDELMHACNVYKNALHRIS